METTMRAALVTQGPAWPGDTEWTVSFIFSSTDHARRYFDNNPRVLKIEPDHDSEFFTAFGETWTREPCTKL